MKIEVTADDIRNGTIDCSTCPIALAIVRVEGRSAIVGLVSFWFYDDYRKSYAIPEIAQDFIRNFDNGGPVQPLSFEVEL